MPFAKKLVKSIVKKLIPCTNVSRAFDEVKDLLKLQVPVSKKPVSATQSVGESANTVRISEPFMVVPRPRPRSCLCNSCECPVCVAPEVVEPRNNTPTYQPAKPKKVRSRRKSKKVKARLSTGPRDPRIGSIIEEEEPVEHTAPTRLAFGCQKSATTRTLTCYPIAVLAQTRLLCLSLNRDQEPQDETLVPAVEELDDDLNKATLIENTTGDLLEFKGPSARRPISKMSSTSMLPYTPSKMFSVSDTLGGDLPFPIDSAISLRISKSLGALNSTSFVLGDSEISWLSDCTIEIKVLDLDGDNDGTKSMLALDDSEINLDTAEILSPLPLEPPVTSPVVATKSADLTSSSTVLFEDIIERIPEKERTKAKAATFFSFLATYDRKSSVKDWFSTQASRPASTACSEQQNELPLPGLVSHDAQANVTCATVDERQPSFVPVMDFKPRERHLDLSEVSESYPLSAPKPARRLFRTQAWMDTRVPSFIPY